MRRAFILAAGLGTRLKPLTDTVPKALVEAGGRPLLGRLIEKLKRAGVTQIVINVHHFPDQILAYLQENGNFGIDIEVSDERDFLRETGGAIRYARPLLTRGGASEEAFLVHNVDILSDLDLNWLEAAARPDALSTLVVSARETRRCLLFDEEMRLVGWTDTATGEIRSPFPGRNFSGCRKLAFAGIHLISPRIFPAFEALAMPDRFSVIDFYIKACARYRICGAVPPQLHLLDVGKRDTIGQADRFLSGQAPLLL